MKNKKTLKLFITLITTVMLASVFVSCAPPQSDVEDTSEATFDSSEASTEATIPNGLNLVLNGKSSYTIVHPENCEEYIKNNAKELRQFIRDKTRANINIVSDGGATPKNLSENEILIGKTNRKESIEAYNHLDFNGTKAFISGNKIVLAAHTHEAMADAVSALKKQMRIPKDSKSINIQKLNLIKNGIYGIKNITLNNIDLWNYGIVATGDEILAFVNNVCNVIGKASGVVPYIYSSADALPSGVKPLFIGNAVAPAEMGNTYYGFGAANGGFAIYFADAQGRTRAYTDFQNALADKTADSIELIDIIKPESKQASGTQTSADLKIMSFNVLNGWTSSNIGNRDDKTAEQILLFEPDVLGLQEFDDYYRNATGTPLTTLISEKYAEVGANVNSWNPIFYNKTTLKLLVCGHEKYSNGTTYDSYNYNGQIGSKFRTITWALFEHNESGKQFLVFNTHLDVEESKQPLQVTELKDKINELKTMFGLNDIFLMGDLNSNVTSDTAKALFSFGFKDTHDLAESKDNLHSSATKGEEISGSYSSAIDHLYCIGDSITVSSYTTVTTIRDTSDHCPIQITLTIN